MKKNKMFLSIDIEADGNSPIVSSMLSFAIIAMTIDKFFVDSFTRNLELQVNSRPDPQTTAWWNSSALCRLMFINGGTL
jgi:hypothetical protein